MQMFSWLIRSKKDLGLSAGRHSARRVLSQALPASILTRAREQEPARAFFSGCHPVRMSYAYSFNRQVTIMMRQFQPGRFVAGNFSCRARQADCPQIHPPHIHPNTTVCAHACGMFPVLVNEQTHLPYDASYPFSPAGA